jgi:hypothetical protein
MVKRYQRGNQKHKSMKDTIQWPKDTKGEIRSCKSMKDTIQWPKDTKGEIRSCKSMKDTIQ